MLKVALLLAVVLLGACASVPRQSASSSSATVSPLGDLWVLVGSEVGLPVSAESAQYLFAAWSSAARSKCKGSFIGNPYLQVTSFAQPGLPFAEPFAPGASTKFTAALGNARCTDSFASLVAP